MVLSVGYVTPFLYRKLDLRRLQFYDTVQYIVCIICAKLLFYILYIGYGLDLPCIELASMRLCVKLKL